ncbi:hypothetical protein Tco_0392650 [Tanacetum coccineum]
MAWTMPSRILEAQKEAVKLKSQKADDIEWHAKRNQKTALMEHYFDNESLGYNYTVTQIFDYARIRIQ